MTGGRPAPAPGQPAPVVDPEKALTAGARRKALPVPAAKPIGERLATAKIDKPQPGRRVPEFPVEAQPNSIIKRLGQKGQVTHYMEYGPDGLPNKRVDLTGATHNGIPTPHVVDYIRRCGRGGKVFSNKSRIVRPARPEEVP